MLSGGCVNQVMHLCSGSIAQPMQPVKPAKPDRQVYNTSRQVKTIVQILHCLGVCNKGQEYLMYMAIFSGLK